MDLHLAATAPTDAERVAVDAVLARTAPAAHGGAVAQAAGGGRAGVGGLRIRQSVRHLLLPALHGVQDAIGWISPAALNYISERLGVPPAEAYGVATFYSLLSTTEQPPRVAHVCDDIACRGAGALHLCRQLEQRLGPAHHAGGPAKAAHHGAPGHGIGAGGTGTDGTGTRSPRTGAAVKELATPRSADAGGTDRTAPGGAATGGIATNAVATGRPTASGGVTALVAADEVAADAVILSGCATWVASPCLGLCEAAPAVLLQLAGEPDATLAPATADAVCAALAAAPATEGAAPVAAAGPAADAVPAAARAALQVSDPVASASRSAPQVSDPVASASRSAPQVSDPVASASRSAPQVSVPVASASRSAPQVSAPVASASRSAPQVSAPVASASRSAPQVSDPVAAAQLTLLRRVGQADPERISDYRRHGGCAALRRAVELGPDGVLRELRDAKLQGRGGAAFPTAAKWEAVAGAAARPHYVVCNADESEPGTFKDRVVMEQDPFAVIEAMVIAGFATTAATGYLYIRGEYPLATYRLQAAIGQARDWGLLGRDIMGLGVDFDLELRRGAGAYICGEETALFNSLEGFRGEPRSKPPYPTEAGLFGKPTAVNNVETLINLLPIVLGGGRAYAAVGTEQSTGPKLFCLSGAVAAPGVYEVEFGATMRELLELAGGTTGGEPRAILLGGAAGSFVGPEHLDLPLTFEDTRAAGTTLGSGVVMPFPPGTDFLDITRRIAQFFRDESCGQCVPCRVGTVRQEEALVRLCGGGGGGGAERGLLADLAQVMGDASICGLGHTAASALQSALRLGLLDRNGEG